MRWFAMAALLLAALPAAADKFEYLGRDKATGAARVDRGAAGKHTVQEGDEIPGLGRVKSVEDHQLKVERRLSKEERDALKASGALPVEVDEIRVPRKDLRLTPLVLQ